MVGSGADEGVRKMSLLPAFNEPMLWTFPCGLDKKPRTKHGFHDAVQGVRWRNYPLMGVPTGRRNDFDVLDIDGDAGLRWYQANYDAIPQTRAHSTQRGMHLLFRYAPGLHCSTGSKTSGIAPGIDVRMTGGYCIWWPREGYPIEDHPLSEWPEWLYEEARGKSRLEVYPNTLPSSLPHSLPPDAVVAEPHQKHSSSSTLWSGGARVGPRELQFLALVDDRLQGGGHQPGGLGWSGAWGMRTTRTMAMRSGASGMASRQAIVMRCSRRWQRERLGSVGR